MTTPTRAQYEALLVQLHGEMRAGRSEAQRAEELRSEMAALWYDLSDDDPTLFDELSEDLYLIEGQRAVVPLAEEETTEAVWQQLEKAFKAEENRRALALSRKLPTIDARTAYAIARCWERLGFPSAAVCFYDFAYEQERKPVYVVSALEALVRANRVQDAMSRVDEVEHRLIVEGTLLLEAASILHRAAPTLDVERRAALYDRVVRLVEVAWIDSTALPSMRAGGLLSAGFSYEHLGRSGDALRSFERAAAIYPKEAPLLAYGLALLKTNRRQAVVLFTMAVRQGTRLDWPYLYAAQSALEDQRFAEAEKFCEAGLSLTDRAELRGRFYEWSAIAAANLGRPSEEVRERFDRAFAELPLDPTIRKNAAAFAEFSRNRSWNVEPPEDEKAPTLLALEKAVTGKRGRQDWPELAAAA